MTKTALLVVSFGTSVDTARSSITEVESTLCDAVPAASFVRAFTSPIIRKLLAARGDAVYSFAEALKHLAEEGFGEVIVQPTHLLYGYEYNRVKETAESFAPCFGSLLLGKPLLSDTEDICRLA
ncbi:MAG: sirohydrochlorin cobaltochelatase, partial [Angelakisella sp.]